MADWLIGIFAWCYYYGLYIAWALVAFSILSLPLLALRSARIWISGLFAYTGMAIGSVAWLLSAVLVLSKYGFFIFLMGTLFGGVGLYPVALFAGFMAGSDGTEMALSIIGLLVSAIVFYVISYWIGQWASSPRAEQAA